MKNQGKYRVQLCVHMDSLTREFSEAVCAVRSYKRLHQEFVDSLIKNGGRVSIRLWNMHDSLLLISSEMTTVSLNVDEEFGEAMMKETI